MQKSTEYLPNLKSDVISDADVKEFIDQLIDLKIEIEAIEEAITGRDLYLKDPDSFDRFIACMQSMRETLEVYMDNTFDVLPW